MVIASLLLVSGSTKAQDIPATVVMNSQAQSALVQPFWRSDTMHGESLFFVQQTGELPQAHLLFEPLELLAVKSATGEITYEEGKDYLLNRETRTLTLPPGSRIPFKTAAEVRPPQSSPHTLKGAGTPERGFLWSEGRFFHDLQTQVTYTHATDAWQGTVPNYAGELLPRTIHKLRAREPLNIVVLGDSISAGYNASGFVKAPPFMPPYPELVQHELERYYGAPVQLTNLSVAGQTTSWGLKQTAAVIAAQPDLVILAFGMNDSARLKTELYLSNTRQIIQQVKAATPGAEFVLVSSSLPNPDLSRARIETLGQFEAGLQEISDPGVAVADVTAVWTELLKHKNYLSISGNGINHPNDFGHRAYAQIVLGLLMEQPAPR